jgi:crotonobetainyl-CoA:carnitine CoA-transferase CaiB-like acyl-CoA transferase
MVQTLEEVLNCPQVNYRNHFDQVEHAIGGLASYSTLPFKFSKSGQPLTVVAPKIGEHTDEILQKILSYGKDKITKLKEDRIV